MLYGSLILIILRIYRIQPFTNVVLRVPAWSDIPVRHVFMLYSLHHHGAAAAVRSVSVTACDDVSTVGPVNVKCAVAHVLKMPEQLLLCMHTKDMYSVFTTISKNSQQINRSQVSTERFIQPTVCPHIRRDITAGNEW